MSDRIENTPEMAEPPMPAPPPSAPPGRSARALWAGLLIVGVLLVGIALALQLRQRVLEGAIPIPANVPDFAPGQTLAPDIAGVLPVSPPRPLTDFALPASTGQTVALSDLRGRWVLLFFGFTHCPDFCPLTMAKFKQVKTALETGGMAEPVEYVMISVDPARDTPDVMREYLARFDPTFLGFSGDNAVLAGIAEDYGLYWQLNTDEGENYTVDHSTQSYLIDPEGRLAAVFTFDATAADMAAGIEAAVREGSDV